MNDTTSRTVPFAKAVGMTARVEPVRPSATWPNVNNGTPLPAPVPFTPVTSPAPNTLVLLDDKTVLLALDLTQAQRHEMADYLNDDYPEFRWVVLAVRGATTVADLRGDPDLTAKAQALWDRARADLTPG